MKHQIAFVGGQVLPVQLGIKEFTPDVLFLVVSPDSQSKTASIRSVNKGIKITEVVCDPFDFHDVKAACLKIISQIDKTDEIAINLTGGTKIMVMAGQALINEDNVKGFYINQNNAVLHLPTFAESRLNADLTADEFIGISGHEFATKKLPTSFDGKAVQLSHKIFAFCVNDFRYKKIMAEVTKKFKNPQLPIPATGSFKLGKTEVKWEADKIVIAENHKELYRFQSPIIHHLFFNSAWWELIVANEVVKWKKAKEVYVNCELPFKGDKTNMKNEIDVLVNLGHRLIFIECKSGRVKQDDINRIRVIRETYGGVISKSVLVCVDMPYPNIVEKCRELNIEVFACYMGKLPIRPIDQIITVLESIKGKHNLW